MAASTDELEALLPSHRKLQDSPESTVQLAVRLPRKLRERVHEAATAEGKNVTQFVIDAITQACDRTVDPAADFAARVARNIQQRLASALDDGSWDQAVNEFAAEDDELDSG